MYTKYNPLQREACILELLQRFAWAPRLLCTGNNYILSSYSGQPVCRESAPSDFTKRVGKILSDMHSIGIRHNDLHKTSRTDFMIDLRTGRMSLLDYGWASINGSLSINCTSSPNHQRRTAVDFNASALQSRQLNLGFSLPETPERITLPSCHKTSTSHSVHPPPGFVKFMQRGGIGSQSKTPVVKHQGSSLYVDGYQHFKISSNGTISLIQKAKSTK